MNYLTTQLCAPLPPSEPLLASITWITLHVAFWTAIGLLCATIEPIIERLSQHD